MDNSKLPKMTTKSSESPWEPTDKSRSHERKRLSDRAGTVKTLTGLPGDHYGDQKSWKGHNAGIMSHGKTKSGKPIRRKKGGFQQGPKRPQDESEY